MSTQNDPLVLTGTQSNATQLEVTAHAPQDHPIQTWRIGGGAVAQISQDGRLEVGDQAVASSASAALIEANQNINSGSGITQGLQARGIVSGAGAINQPLTWSQHELEVGGTGGVSSAHQALRSIVTQNNTGSGASAEMRAGSFEVKNNQTLNKAVAVRAEITNASGGNLTEAAAFEVVPPSAGTINTFYGLRIPDLTVGTNRYAIRTGQGQVYLGGPLIVEQSTPTISLRSPAGQARFISFNTNAYLRWLLYIDGSPENTPPQDLGSHLHIYRYDAAGTPWDAMIINRSNGTVTIPGYLSKLGGGFFIDHPLDPANRNLVHSFVEGPRADLVYRGKALLSKGRASVDIDTANRMTPGTFEALTRHVEAQVWVQNDTGWEPVRGKVVGGNLEIECREPESADTVSWLVIAERADAFMRWTDATDDEGRLIVELDKPLPSDEDLQAVKEEIELETGEPRVPKVMTLNGKRGYPMHPESIGIVPPTR